MDIEELLNEVEYTGDEFYVDSPCFDRMEAVMDSRLIRYNYGATKFVIFDEDEHCVYKIPFKGTEGYSEFQGASGTWDYCEVELNIYKSAVEEGLGSLFAALEFVGVINGFYIYKQPIFTTEEDFIELFNVTKDEYAETVDYVESHEWCDSFSDEWLCFARKYYDESLLKKLFAFIDGVGITDLCNRNCGMDINGRPVIVDYGGYYEYFDEDNE